MTPTQETHCWGSNMPRPKTGKADPITKVEFHALLQEWLSATDEQTIGPDETQWWVIKTQSKYYGFHANTQRPGVERYLALVSKYGEHLEWGAVTSQRGKPSKIVYGPEAIPVKLFSLHLLPESRKIQVDRISPDDADEAPDTEPFVLNYRQVVQQQIRHRRGQRKFRDALRIRYCDTCVVTGCKIVDLLEAAHIRTMSGVDDNSPENGLLLRADIHTLFDLNLLGIDPMTLKVHLHASIKTSEYAEYDGQPLRDRKGKPLIDFGSHPSIDALSDRFETFRP